MASDSSSVNFVTVKLLSAEFLHQRLRGHRFFLAGEIAERVASPGGALHQTEDPKPAASLNS